ncbi:hypothetical protein LZ30DRAFT_694546 [Colletotrichum cereale]|nr:hypothetical protein LZ30DRAFT_694546 [Colletotrichum cereale]
MYSLAVVGSRKARGPFSLVWLSNICLGSSRQKNVTPTLFKSSYCLVRLGGSTILLVNIGYYNLTTLIDKGCYVYRLFLGELAKCLVGLETTPKVLRGALRDSYLSSYLGDKGRLYTTAAKGSLSSRGLSKAKEDKGDKNVTNLDYSSDTTTE